MKDHRINQIFKRSIMVVVGIWLLFGFSFIAYKVLHQDNTFAATDQPGDGVGTIAGIGFLKSQPFLQNNTNQMVAPLMVVPSLLTDHWGILKQVLGVFYSPDNVYDFLVMAFWLLNLWAGYYLFRTLQLDHFSAFIFGLVVAGLEVFQFRISRHLTLSTYFIPLLQLAFAYKILNLPRGRNIYIISCLSFVSFLANEYWGYFGFIFSMALIGLHYLVHWKKIKEFRIKEILLGVAIFSAGMLIFYANIFSTLAGNGGSKALVIHSYGEHLFSSVQNPFGILTSSLYSRNLDPANPEEFSFHLGAFIFIFILVLLLLARIRKVHLDHRFILPTFYSGLILALFGLNPNYGISLEKLTYKIAPQFRVAARAYLWVDLAVIIIAALIFRDIAASQDPKGTKDRSLGLGLSFSLVILLMDATLGFYIKGPDLYLIPDNTAYQAISRYPQGLLLELPFFSPADPPELSYPYLYDYYDHKKMIVNYPSKLMYQYDPVLASGLDHLKPALNQPSLGTIDLLQRAGVRYIVVRDPQIKAVFDRLRYFPVVDQAGVAIYALQAKNELELRTITLCNAFPMVYDLATDRKLTTEVGTWSQEGIFSNGGVAGVLLNGPKVVLGSGEYILTIRGELLAGSAKIEIDPQSDPAVHQEITLDGSMVDQNRDFDLQIPLSLNGDMNPLAVKILIGEGTVIRVSSYRLGKLSADPKCQGLELNTDRP
jgi:hypothetical protein